LLAIFLLAFVILKLLNFLVHRLKRLIMLRTTVKKNGQDAEFEKRVDTLLGILKTVIRVAVWSVVIMAVLKKIGVDIAPLIAGAGIAGLAVGFGAQELVRDIISGFFLLLENQIRIGDVVIINGAGGLVETITLRTITLRDESGVIHIFQNGKINSLSNMTKEWSGIVFSIPIDYKEDVDRVIGLIEQVGGALREDPAFTAKILEPLEVFGVDDLAGGAVLVKARFKTKPIEQWTVGREFRRRLKKKFDENHIEIPTLEKKLVR
jgi:small conductance mechanosensitive channel